MKLAFDTGRLRVFIDQVKPTEHNTERDIFIAFRTDEDRPMVCATALVLDCREALGERVVDWMEVASEHRRRKIGSELLMGIERHYGERLHISPGSRDGERFCARYRSPITNQKSAARSA